MWTRRKVLKALGAAPGLGFVPFAPRNTDAAAEPHLDLRLTAALGEARVRAGAPTRVLRYTGEVLRGQRDAIRASTGYLGPTLELRRGERVRIEVVNRTGDPTVIHWHGMIVPDTADGHPHQAVRPGGSYTIEFTVRNPAGTYLYHPHPHRITGRQTYFGLAGLLIVREPAEREIGLPGPEHELELVLQDRRIGADNQFVFKRMMMDDMNGVLGDRVLVNGLDDARFKVAPRAYRLRIANVSNARIYKLAWSDGRPLTAIASDSGLFSRVEGVQERPYVTLFPFERVELLEDFGARPSGTEFALVSRAFLDDSMGAMMQGMMGSGGGMMGGMMGGGMMGGMMGPSQGEEMNIARFTVSPGPRARPAKLALPADEPRVKGGKHELHTQLAFRHMRGFLNGRSFDAADMMAVAEDEWLPVGKPAVWTFSNDGPGMPMSHPIHIHGVRFRIIERSAGSVPADLREGLIDAGFKDTFSIFPDERVRVLVTPSVPGLFMYHCHNLEHEDGGMMRNCLFRA
ncbi:MAG TPA: multicopper oxidase domain-containing protein [Burkholderiales bacterium]|nr:multicopper oxidase domain-containing protein [Burkholderiales bacterium]